MNLGEIIDTLSKGSVDKWVTLLEGWRVEQIAEVVEEELGLPQQEFISVAQKDEGYLFPDTYLFSAVRRTCRCQVYKIETSQNQNEASNTEEHVYI